MSFDTTTYGKCSKKDPTTCRLHGKVIAMQKAQAAGDFDAYFQARTKVENIKRDGWQENPPKTTTSLNEKIRGIKPENILTNLSAFPEDHLRILGINSDDEIAYGKRRPYGYSAYTRPLYRRNPGGTWQRVYPSGSYNGFDIEQQARTQPGLSEQELLVAALLYSASLAARQNITL